jgi:hypothetical protein
MSTIVSVARNFNNMAKGFSQAVQNAIEQTKESIADLNASQLAQGIRSDGSKITPEYSTLTIELKLGQPGLSGIVDRVTLYNEGNFYRGITVTNITPSTYDITSTDWKTKKLEDKYGVKILGLTVENRSQYAKGPFWIKLKAYIESTSKLRLS